MFFWLRSCLNLCVFVRLDLTYANETVSENSIFGAVLQTKDYVAVIIKLGGTCQHRLGPRPRSPDIYVWSALGLRLLFTNRIYFSSYIHKEAKLTN